jgi:hypothetical protein
MVSGKSPARPDAASDADRRRVDWTGIERGQDPLGPHVAVRSFSVTT